MAIGGDLSIARLLKAYHSGIFPWYGEDSPICWYAPPERCVLFPEKLKIQKSLRPLLNKGTYRISRNEAFEAVIQSCATIPRSEQGGTWITADMQEAYLRLHKAGHAQSVEVWQGEALVGGLYGVLVNRVFCGESMFSRAPNASKLALIHLCRSGDFRLIDCQIPNPFLISMGAEMLPRAEFVKYLQKSLPA